MRLRLGVVLLVGLVLAGVAAPAEATWAGIFDIGVFSQADESIETGIGGSTKAPVLSPSLVKALRDFHEKAILPIAALIIWIGYILKGSEIQRDIMVMFRAIAMLGVVLGLTVVGYPESFRKLYEACRTYRVAAESPLKITIQDHLMGPSGSIEAELVDLHVAYHYAGGGAAGELAIKKLMDADVVSPRSHKIYTDTLGELPRSGTFSLGVWESVQAGLAGLVAVLFVLVRWCVAVGLRLAFLLQDFIFVLYVATAPLFLAMLYNQATHSAGVQFLLSSLAVATMPLAGWLAELLLAQFMGVSLVVMGLGGAKTSAAVMGSVVSAGKALTLLPLLGIVALLLLVAMVVLGFAVPFIWIKFISSGNIAQSVSGHTSALAFGGGAALAGGMGRFFAKTPPKKNDGAGSNSPSITPQSSGASPPAPSPAPSPTPPSPPPVAPTTPPPPSPWRNPPSPGSPR